MDHLQCLGRAGTGATAYVFKAQSTDGKVCAVKTSKLATDATTTKQADNAAMDGEFLRTLSGHPNIVKLHRIIAAPLPDAFLNLIPEVDQAPFKKTKRGGIGGQSIASSWMTIHRTCSWLSNESGNLTRHARGSSCAYCGACCRRASTCCRKASCIWT